ncbi:MAG TPA: polyprenyl diphosphate synthase [Candidatus Limnocylindria bacterium]|jgi:undecaprenyl diphosphate synthase|nr:polyprenyl diphosphate synthase [Candidatus Limnocylindria bacterium]
MTPPVHIGIIMDGNNRWARQRLLPREAGHRAGVESIRRVAEACETAGVRVLTVYGFSTENWARPSDEVAFLMQLFEETIPREVAELAERGIELRFSGRIEELSPSLQQLMRDANLKTRDNAHAVLNIAVNYGGRSEIVDAIRAMARAGADLRTLDEAAVSDFLYTQGLPDPDLIIRTAGEMRLSNFLLWQSAYAEFYSTPTLWPDFGEADLEQALVAYQSRVRRFGARPEEEVSHRARQVNG